MAVLDDGWIVIDIKVEEVGERDRENGRKRRIGDYV